MRGSVILVIQKYIDECLSAPESIWQKDRFAEYSYSRWAAEELQRRIIAESSRLPEHLTGREPRSPVDIISEFASEMDCFSEIREGSIQAVIFSTAYDVAKDLLYLLS